MTADQHRCASGAPSRQLACGGRSLCRVPVPARARGARRAAVVFTLLRFLHAALASSYTTVSSDERAGATFAHLARRRCAPGAARLHPIAGAERAVSRCVPRDEGGCPRWRPPSVARPFASELPDPHAGSGRHCRLASLPGAGGEAPRQLLPARRLWIGLRKCRTPWPLRRLPGIYRWAGKMELRLVLPAPGGAQSFAGSVTFSISGRDRVKGPICVIQALVYNKGVLSI